MYQCFHCGKMSVVWEGDFGFEEFGLEGEGIVHTCSCSNCNADIQYFVPVEDGENKGC